jgi:chlorobactene glucosyltransferase
MIDFFAEIHIHLFFLLATVYFVLLSSSNVIWLRLSSRKPRITAGDKVSVLIPARNEEENIGRCLESLIDQNYENYEIIVLDDQSTDRTREIITGYERKYPDLIKAVQGKPLPESGWAGKPHAMQQLSEYATGDYFLFTDADTVHSKESIAWAVTNIEFHRVDFVSGYVFQELKTFGERLIIPGMYIMSAFILPLWLVPSTRIPGLSFAIGQMIMFKRHAFEAIGGYAAISEYISDDIFIARELKKAGFRIIFLDIRKYVRCRMYEGYGASFNGIQKNLYDFLKNRPTFLAVAVSVFIFVALLPLGLLIIRLFGGTIPIKSTELSVVLFFFAWTVTLYDRGLRWWVPFLYPLMFLNLLLMIWRGVGRTAVGKGVVWKGRTIR